MNLFISADPTVAAMSPNVVNGFIANDGCPNDKACITSVFKAVELAGKPLAATGDDGGDGESNEIIVSECIQKYKKFIWIPHLTLTFAQCKQFFFLPIRKSNLHVRIIIICNKTGKGAT